MKFIFGLVMLFVAVLLIINLAIYIPEIIGKFLFNIFGLEYSSFSIWFLLIFGSLSIIFFIASKESYRDYIVKRKVYKILSKIIGGL